MRITIIDCRTGEVYFRESMPNMTEISESFWLEHVGMKLDSIRVIGNEVKIYVR